MHSPSTISSFYLALTLLLSKALASPIGGTPGNCFSPGTPMMKYDPIGEPKRNVQGPPVTGEWSCVGTGGTCTMDAQTSYSVSVSVSIGMDLGLDFAEIAGSAGISAEVSVAEEHGETQGVSKGCPDGPWTCALIIWPPVTEVSGTQTPLSSVCTPIEGQSKPYTVQLPEKDSDGLTGARVDICACRNFAHWADPGAPSIVCPQDCTA